MFRIRSFAAALAFSLALSAPASAQFYSQSRSIGVPAFTKGKAFNPDIGANFLGLVQRGTGLSDSRINVPHNGFSLQEAEFQFTADVDVYLRAVALFSAEQQNGATNYGIAPEEVFVETISLPRVTLRAGKFKLAFGKHNQLHTHAFPFLDAPLIHQTLLGDEGLNEAGASAAVLLPTDWYSELIVQGYSAGNETLFGPQRLDSNGLPVSGSPRTRDLGGLARLKNLWDLTDDFTMELGVSGTQGKNQFDRISTVLGGDLTFKWRPALGGKYHAVIWSTEYLEGMNRGTTDPATAAPAEKLGGVASWVQYQFAERWWAQTRFEYVGMPHDAPLRIQSKQSALLGFFPSEFSGLRLQYDRLKTQGARKTDHTVAFQYNVGIGAHPAHAY
ncbi:MAG: hypothetical protein HYW49_09180 [Deltaproteobacteria bacterium]|nr:hypothetical protein [Deltaproteobacteria bacterium]